MHFRDAYKSEMKRTSSSLSLFFVLILLSLLLVLLSVCDIDKEATTGASESGL